MKKFVFVVIALLYSFIGVNMVFAADGTWTQKDDFGGTQRLVAFGFSIADKGYAGGGVDYSNGYSNRIPFKDFWEYDPVTDIWTQKDDLPINMSGAHVSFSINNKGYVGTGAIGGSGQTKLFLEYDSTLNKWSQKADFGGIARMYASGFAIAGKGYIGTGWGDGGNSDPNNLNPILKDFWEYDPSTDIWTKKADFGEGIRRDDAVGFSIGNKGYIGTGYSGEGLHKDLWEYDTITDSWTRKADFAGTARALAIGLSIANKGYIGTGDDGIDDTGINETDFWEYDPVTDIWTQKADFGGGARIIPIAFSISNKGYLGMGVVYDPNGGPMTNKQDFWEFDPTGGVNNIFLVSVADKTSLWPANNKMVPVTIRANVSSSTPVTITVQVSCNEDAKRDVDWNEPIIDQATGVISLSLRATREGSGNGRIYTITITATDANGNSATETIDIVVPHDQGNN